MPYTDDATGFPINGFAYTIDAQFITLESVVAVPNGGTFRRDLGTFNRLTEDQELRDAIDDTFSGGEEIVVE